MSKMPVIYSTQSYLYDIINSQKDYSREALELRAEVSRHCRSNGKSLLDVGCGTGRHIQFLSRWFNCTGLDASRSMLALARKRLPGTRLILGRMEDFALTQRFDVVTCLFGVLGYAKTLNQMRRSVSNLSKHLSPGGLLLIQPWYSPYVFVPNGISTVLTAESDDLNVVRVSRLLRPSTRLSRQEVHYLVSPRWQPVRHFRETHDLGLFAPREVQKAMRSEGLTCRWIPQWHNDVRGLHIGVASVRS